MGPSIVLEILTEGNSTYSWFSASLGAYDMGLICFDENGSKKYEKAWAQGSPVAGLPDGNGNIYFVYLNGNSSLHITMIDSSGNILFDKPMPGDSTAGYDLNSKMLKYDRNHNLHYLIRNPNNVLFGTMDTLCNAMDSVTIQWSGFGSGDYVFDNANNKYFYKLSATNTYIRKYDPAFNQIWQKGSYSNLGDVIIDSNNNLYTLQIHSTVGGMTNILHKIDSAGNLLWSHPFNESSLYKYYATRLILDGSGSPLVAGNKHDVPSVSGSDPTNKYFFEKIKPNGMISEYYEGYDSVASAAIIRGPHTSGTPFNFVLLSSASQGGQNVIKLQRFCSICNNNLRGRVYYDANQDCDQDFNEVGVENRIIEINPGPYYTISDFNGDYHAYLPDSVYSVWCAPPQNWLSSCPVVPVVDSIVNQVGSIDSIQFGMKQLTGLPNLLVNIAHTPVRVVRPITYIINYQNLGDDIAAGEVKFGHEPFMFMQSSVPTNDFLAGDTLGWYFTNLLAGESRNIVLTFNIPNGTSGTYYNIATIEGMIGDVDAGNNIDIDSGEVVGSYDPNQKQVKPKGTGAEGFISVSDSVLLYKIMVQNIGNDTAFDVMVVDTLDSDLNVSSLHVGAVSHPYTYDVTGSGVLKFHLDNILLPDSSTDEPHSHALINYYIKQKKNLPLGTRIINFADAYFDFNTAVRTNSTLNTVLNFTHLATMSEGQLVFIYPNPANSSLRFQFTEAAKKSAMKFNTDIYCSTGQKIYSKSDCTQESILDVTGLNNGYYIVTLCNDQFIYRMGFIKN